ncbi:hypothetical protein FJZ48_02800 [Candidatus Uhrbacteria bacterium]|nr:hypothetical protein [Candidatus Uhrbacteria bacterium]
MLASEIIAKFELYVDDTTELSSSEELALLNKIYHKVCDDRPWEILKKEASGSMTSTTSITLPSDFSYLVENLNYTDNSYSTENNAKPVAVRINGTSLVQVINWSDRNQYLNNAGYAYVDLASNTLKFMGAQPSGATYAFDYKAVPTDLVLAGTPVFPARFHDILYHGMCVDDMVIQLFDKAKSYADFHQTQFNDYLKRLALWNANLQNY